MPLRRNNVKEEVVGLLELKGKYRFVTNMQQLGKLLRDIGEGKAQHEILLVDTSLVADSRAKAAVIIFGLVQQSRQLALSVVFIGEKDTKLDRRFRYCFTDVLSLQAKPVFVSPR